MSDRWNVTGEACIAWQTSKKPSEKDLEVLRRAVEKALLKIDTKYDWNVWFGVDKVYATRYDCRAMRVAPAA